MIQKLELQLDAKDMFSSDMRNISTYPHLLLMVTPDRTITEGDVWWRHINAHHIPDEMIKVPMKEDIAEHIYKRPDVVSVITAGWNHTKQEVELYSEIPLPTEKKPQINFEKHRYGQNRDELFSKVTPWLGELFDACEIDFKASMQDSLSDPDAIARTFNHMLRFPDGTPKPDSMFKFNTRRIMDEAFIPRLLDACKCKTFNEVVREEVNLSTSDFAEIVTFANFLGGNGLVNTLAKMNYEPDASFRPLDKVLWEIFDHQHDDHQDDGRLLTLYKPSELLMAAAKRI